jgi:hypothetical protein
MILVDSSVWIEFFRKGSRSSDLTELLDASEVVTHPFVIGELALGHLGPRRKQILSDLVRLPLLPPLPEHEVHDLVEVRALAGSGLGWIDVHLLGAVLVAKASLWSLDRPLAKAANRLGAGVSGMIGS